MQQGEQRVSPSLALDDGLTALHEGGGIEVGIQAARAMPEHGFHAVLGVFEIDPVVEEMAPDLGRTQIPIEVLKNRQGIEELLLCLINQVDAVGIQHLAVALEHSHHFQQVVGGVGKQGFSRQQPPLQFFCGGHPPLARQGSRNNGH